MKAFFTRITRFLERLGPQLVFALALLVGLTLLSGFYLGRHAASNDLQVTAETVSGMQEELSRLRKALEVARGDLEMQRTRHEVDRRALELVRSEMAAEKDRTAELEEGLSVYRSMVGSEDVANGMSLRKPELVQGEVPGHVAYRIFVQQKEREYEMLEGVLSVEVYGVSGGKEVSFPLARLSKEFDQGGGALHFRYFQAIEGEMVLPEEFQPNGMSLVARASKPRQSEVRGQFPWELQERFINVGK
jgi:hypothetical protein